MNCAPICAGNGKCSHGKASFRRRGGHTEHDTQRAHEANVFLRCRFHSYKEAGARWRRRNMLRRAFILGAEKDQTHTSAGGGPERHSIGLFTISPEHTNSNDATMNCVRDTLAA